MTVLVPLRFRHDSGRTSRRPPVGVIIAITVLAFTLAAALLPRVLAPYDPFTIDLGATLRPPSWAHPFGTDLSGRDLFSRVVYGTRESLLIGLGATAIALSLAVALGLLAALSTRVFRAVSNRTIEVLFAFPALLLALLFVTVFGPGRNTLILAIGIGTAPGYARIVRGQVLAVKDSPYVEAASALGHSRLKILRQHMAPNALRPLLVTAMLGVGQSIVWASGLAFLGLGVPPPTPEWGALLDAGRTYITEAWWLEIFPGVAVVLVALALTITGRHLATQLEGNQK